MSEDLDINLRGDFEKKALATADALSQIAKHEEHVNALAEKLGTSQQKVMQATKMVAAKEAERNKKDSTAASLRKKHDEDTKEKLNNVGKAVLGVGAAAIGAAAAVAGIGIELAKTAYEASQSKREASAMIDAFTDHHGAETLKVLDQLAKNLGVSVSDVRDEFVQFRQAGMTNAMSAQLIKTRADLIATGLSAKKADEEISHVLSAGRNRAQAAHELQEIERAYTGVGSGAKAAAYNAANFEGALAQVKNETDDKLVDIWGKIGPGIGRAAHALADFVSKLMDSEEGQEAIDGVVNAINSVTAAVTSENLTTGLNVIKATASAIATVFDAVGTAIGWVVSEITDFVSSGSALKAVLNPLGFIVDKMSSLGASAGQGFIEGLAGSKNAASDEAAGVAQSVGKAFASELGIQSPSKVFAGFGKDTVAGFEQGQQKATSALSMPLHEKASAPVSSPATQPQTASAQAPMVAPTLAQPRGDSGRPNNTVTIQHLVVQGGGDPKEIARSIRQEIQLLLNAGALSQGVT